MAVPAALQVCVLVSLAQLTGLCWAQAPGDEDVRCTEEHSSPPTYPDTEKNLMDSYNYEQLLPGNGTGDDPIPNAVWNDYSFDDNDITPEVTNPTYWQQRSGGLCRFQPRVCGWTNGTTIVDQNNWLFTQYINKSFNSTSYDYDVTIHVMVAFSTPNCRENRNCTPWLNIHHYMTNSVQLPSTEESGYMNPTNYVKFAAPKTSGTILTYIFILNFTLPSSSTGFYIAAQDIGGCITLSRMRVYRANCKERQIRFVNYPNAPAPAGQVNISTTCVANAMHLGSPNVTCGSDGTWGQENPVCQCNLGYEDRNTECVACPAGQYRSRDDTTCQQCPANTVMTVVAAPECQCLPGYFRNTESHTHPDALQYVEPANEKPGNKCTKPPSPPKNVNVVAVSSREISAHWSAPAEDGGRTDLHYEVEISDPTQLGVFERTIFLGGTISSYTFSGLRPFTQYCVRVTAHNGVSDQDPDGTRLRRVEGCTETPEDVPGVVRGLEGHCSVVVWDRPNKPNGIVTHYTLHFYINVGNDSGVVVETGSDITYFEIQSPHQLPLTPEGGSLFFRVLAQNGAGKGTYSEPAYIGCETPPGTCTNVLAPFFPPTVPEPVESVLRTGDVLYWRRPNGRISHYLLTVTEDESDTKLLEEYMTHEQFVTLPSKSPGKLSIEVCTVLDGVQGNCTVHKVSSESSSSAASACTESVSVVGGVFSLISVLIIGVLIIIVLIMIHNLKAMLTQAKEGGVRDEDSKSVPMMDSNAAYTVVSHGQRSGGDDVAMYEMVGQSVSSSATRPTADHPSDCLQSSQGPPDPLTHHTQDSTYDVIPGGQ